MKQNTQAIILGATLALLSALSLGAHPASATAVGMGHEPSVPGCFTACTTASLNKEKVVTDTDKKDDEPEPPFYIRSQPSTLSSIEEQHAQEARSARSRQQPPGTVPVYILMNVFRT